MEGVQISSIQVGVEEGKTTKKIFSFAFSFNYGRDEHK